MIRSLLSILAICALSNAHATYYDGETGSLQNGFRTLSPLDGRYRQADPIGIGAGLNRFIYVDQAPLHFVDPPGLDKTRWNNGAGGRSWLNFPTNGNWGGKCWSGGQYSCDGRPMGAALPVDSGDQCYQRHDRCYSICSTDKICIRACDQQLVRDLDALPDDPRRWPLPPPPGTEDDSRSYRDAARRWFK